MALNAVQSEFLNFLEQYWFENGCIPSKDHCSSLGLNSDSLWKHFRDADFRSAVLARGISLRGLEVADTGAINGGLAGVSGKPLGLTEEQLAVANCLLDLRDNRSQRKKLEHFGVSTQKYQGWLRDPSYRDYIQRRAEHYLGDNQHEAHLALVERVRVGDINAIKYFNELTGRYVPTRNANVDVTMVLMRVIEAVQRHVKDPEIQEAIASELLEFAQATKILSSDGVPSGSG